MPPSLAETTDRRLGAAALQAALAGEMRAGRWAVGEKLPTERELGQRYGVARNTVRRALDALEAQGLLHRHVGRGTFRSAPPTAAPAAEEALSPSDVVECRLLLEPEMISLAVARATQADIARMDECLRGTDAAADLAAFEHWDAALHDAFALGTHNGAVIAMSRSLARVRERTDWGQLKARGNTAEHRSTLQAQHHAMVAAVRQRDRAEARRVMREHILFVQDYMFGD
ncbi:FadR family transcriptional regulator [Roseomonas sp. SSH11]|uniref:FadR family transcriptional regulator n=1 Tax=Pararoseomonas baculiformis TaxID=2820812 RepID=A0ABS4AIY0_9PROT|nr:FCD domain-containing protein [Pararoseomonas baculiformis]MBP0446958.1 FadR family transcriptional regulator [Pararoseomonas baculiformis]